MQIGGELWAGSGGDGGLFFSAAPEDDVPRGPASLRILVADDNRDQVLTLLSLLRGEGYEVRGVYDGQAALDAGAEFEPDVYLLDIGMPGMTGYDVARKLRELYGTNPVIVAITAYAQSSDKIAAQLAGFDHHVAKPFAADTLLKLLKIIAAAPPRG